MKKKKEKKKSKHNIALEHYHKVPLLLLYKRDKIPNLTVDNQKTKPKKCQNSRRRKVIKFTLRWSTGKGVVLDNRNITDGCIDDGI